MQNWRIGFSKFGLQMEETSNAPNFNGNDRISRLPDNLIHHIMSFIDTKYAVQTCVLSTRWIHIWKSLPFLDFDRRSFAIDKRNSFIMFVDMVFICRRKDIDIQRFYVRWDNSAYDNTVTLNVNRWCLNAVEYNVQKISVVITQCHDSAYEIPHRLLNCKSLIELVMQVFSKARYADIILPRSMNLPQLKVLSLIGLSISDVESSKRLFLGCPVLETLHIVDCGIQTDNQRELIVDSLSLKKFIYSHHHTHLLPQNDTMAKIIKLCAPNLEIFVSRSFLTQDYSLENCSPLSKVNFNVKLKAKEEDENAETYSKLSSLKKVVYAKRLMKFLRAVYLVKFMRLSPGFLEVLSQAPDLDCQPPLLCNLRNLSLEMWFTRGCLRAIAYLLKISPHITYLFLESKEPNLADVGDDWEAGLSLLGMLSNLEYVWIKRVEGCDNELKFLSFLLKNAKVLKKVVLFPRSTIDSPDKVREQFLDKLRALPRVSSCIIMHWPATKSTHLI